MFPDLTQYLWIIWLVFVVLFVIVELITLEFTFLMLAAGSLVGGLGLNLLGAPWWAQVGAAAVLAALFIFTIRPLLLRTLKRGGDPTRSNVDALHQLGGVVVIAFSEGRGTVKLDNGETWTARLAGDGAGRRLAVGERIAVTRIDGATAVVVREDSPTDSGTGTPSASEPEASLRKDPST